MCRSIILNNLDVDATVYSHRPTQTLCYNFGALSLVLLRSNFIPGSFQNLQR